METAEMLLLKPTTLFAHLFPYLLTAKRTQISWNED